LYNIVIISHRTSFDFFEMAAFTFTFTVKDMEGVKDMNINITFGQPEKVHGSDVASANSSTSSSNKKGSCNCGNPHQTCVPLSGAPLAAAPEPAANVPAPQHVPGPAPAVQNVPMQVPAPQHVPGPALVQIQVPAPVPLAALVDQVAALQALSAN